MKQVFINLPVSDLDKSMKFYQSLGFSNNPLYTDQDQKCLVWTDSIYIMLQSRQFSNSYVEKLQVNVRNCQIPSFTLPVASIELVNEMMKNGINAGGMESASIINEGFMFLRSIEDIDGYVWGIMCLDVEKFKSIKNRNI